ncbi:DUF7439 family protein [Streptomyces viridochromogenes]|uniref:DUF7439 family protein n=1 Tax=Streptomyces viridochromogenes TaxID=1938 RepID=UPI00069CDB1A|nr:hypothetical protein [Streptomyces viridochromogenes]KOG26826.1 hypothetical protein ADK36_02400 [Streptomyces viridochromogenes]
MSKHRRLAPLLVSVLPVRYRSRVAAVLSAVGVIVSVAAVVYADKPEVALIVQIATSLGLVDRPDSGEAG